MPRRTKVKRRGAARPKYTSKGHRFFADTSYRDISKSDVLFGKIVDIVDDRGRSAPLIIVKYDDGKIVHLPAPEGVNEGQVIAEGPSAPVSTGNILPLGSLPEGSVVSNVERKPGDRGSMVRASGSSARIVAREQDKVALMLPSGNIVRLDPRCRATVGKVAGAGRRDKPLIKAGTSFYKNRVRSKLWPVSSATSMNAFDHPLGGGRGRHRKQYITGRKSPRGGRVGTIAPRRTGWRRRK